MIRPNILQTWTVTPLY